MEKPTRTAHQLLARKTGARVHGVAPDVPVLAALQVLADNDIGAVVVLEQDRLVGILSERDYARRVELRGRTAATTPVRDIMTSEVIHVTPEHTADQCMALMHEKRIRHLPVVEGGRVVGVLSSRDVLEEVIDEEARLIRELERERLYILNPDPSSY